MNRYDRIFWKTQQLTECIFWIEGELERMRRLLEELLKEQAELRRLSHGVES
jgi:hypothetical protein